MAASLPWAPVSSLDDRQEVAGCPCGGSDGLSLTAASFVGVLFILADLREHIFTLDALLEH